MLEVPEAERGPNFSKYSYEEFPVYSHAECCGTPVHVARCTWGLDSFTVQEATPEWLEWARRVEGIQKMPSADKLEWVDQLHRGRRQRRLEQEQGAADA